ncbi:MAG: RHS repeat-associated core domain-containing protein [Bacteroidota bacterium]|nr:RHS repeat-associated core domain-containing protein [Bacteroidota bacterium]
MEASVGSNGSVLALPEIKAPKNGYAYIYISNQSNNDVYFDNFQAGIVQGNIAEENHYYAYGLKIATLSSKKLGDSYEGSLKNNYLYQGDYSELDDDIGWHDFALRNYDAQIGRWVQQDPCQQFPSPYTGMGNDPINLIDPSGGETLPFFKIATTGLSTTAATAITLGEVVLRSVSKVLPVASKGISLVSKISIVIRTVFTAINILNTSINTAQIGRQAGGGGILLSIAGQGNPPNYTGNENDVFKDKANRLSKQPGYAPAEYVSNGLGLLNVLKTATNKHGSIAGLVIFSHATGSGLILEQNNGFYTEGHTNAYGGDNGASVSNLEYAVKHKEVQFERWAYIVLGGCNCANPSDLDNVSLGESLAKRIGAVTVYAATGQVREEVINGKGTGRIKTDGTFIKIQRFIGVKVVNGKFELDIQTIKTGVGNVIDPTKL